MNISNPTELIKCLFDGAKMAIVGGGDTFLSGFNTVLRGASITAGENGALAIEYGSTYTEFAILGFTLAGIGFAFGILFAIIRKVRHGRV